ncbi:MAG: DUF3667 domain-containing protein [Bacteroidales bacterium]|nr:DUF3667 domain-containing protein [Bacteroidales bacterium]
MFSFKKWLLPRWRLWTIYSKLGYNPWRKPKRREKAPDGEGVYMGAREIIPFMNDDAKRTFSHLLLRPGYMMRDYIMRGQHERYLSPITALLVFFSVFTLIVAIVKPGAAKESVGVSLIKAIDEMIVESDSTDRDSTTFKATKAIFSTMKDALVLTRLDLFPEEADTPLKQSIAAVEGDLRGKGIPLFLSNFLLMWLSLGILLRKRNISFSGAAAASAYILCQFCIFMFFALIFSFGRSTDLGILVIGILLFIDFRQLLGVQNREAFRLTVKTGLTYLGLFILFYVLVFIGLVIYALATV